MAKYLIKTSFRANFKEAQMRKAGTEVSLSKEELEFCKGKKLATEVKPKK